MRYRYSSFPNRTLCAVLDEMRKCYETRNFAPIAGLIEEAQVMGNRMEAGLNDKKDIEGFREERSKLIKELEKLAAKRDELKRKKK